MMKLSRIAIFIFISLSFSETYANKECGNPYCSEYEWYNNGGRFDPLSIRWPLHYTGEVYKDIIDGGHAMIDVAFKSHSSYQKLRYSLGEFRTRPECPDPWFLKDGLKMHDPFECTAWVEDKPSWTSTNCSLIMSGYEDEIVYIDGPACSKILRHWTIIDWCKYKPNTGADKNQDKIELVKDLTDHSVYFAYGNDKGEVKEDGYYSFTQVIKIIDPYKPEFVNCGDEEFDLKGKCEANVKLKKKVIDTGICKGKKIDVWVEVYDKSGKLKIQKGLWTDEGKEFEVALGYLGPGEYLLIWSAKDGCGNTTKCSQHLTVLDKVGPYLLCIQNLSTSVSDNSGVSIWAKDFVLKAESNCGTGPINISFSPDSYVPSMHFDCSDNFGFKNLNIYATDSYGRQSSCYVELYIADHFTCSDSMAIAGLVFNKFLEPIKSVRVDIMKSESKVAKGMTNERGQYAIRGIPMTKSETLLQPIVEDEKTRGINATDLILLLRHIYGIQKFKDVLEYAAADINSDAKIDLEDYWQLADLIYDLPHYDVKINGWKFIDSKLYFAGITKASQLTIPIPLRNFRHRYDILGLKTGDIDFSWKPDPEAKPRAEESISYTVADMTNETQLTIDLSSYENVLGLGLKLKGYHAAAIQKLNQNTPDLFLNLSENKGKTELHIISALGITGEDGKIHIRLPKALAIEEVISVQFAEGEELISKFLTLNQLDEYSTHAAKVYPNPFAGGFELSYQSTTQEELVIRLMDLNGRTVHSKQVAAKPGVNRISFEEMGNILPGVYFLEIRSGKDREVLKLLKLE